MAKIRAQVVLPRKGLLAEDDVVNTFHFEDDSGFATDGGISVNGPGLITRIGTFYTTLGATVFSALLAGTGEVTLYDMADAKPRAPRLTGTFTFATSAAAGPAEVALCLSFAAATASGDTAARRRGRVYLGPVASGMFQQLAGASDVRPQTTTLDTIVNAAKTMATGGSGAFRLAVFSPTTAGLDETLDAAWNDVTRLWVDNAFDTMRSRGAQRTIRRQVLVAGADAPATT
jgi:hypothetical protein